MEEKFLLDSPLPKGYFEASDSTYCRLPGNLTPNLLEDVMKKKSQKVIPRCLGDIFVSEAAHARLQSQDFLINCPLVIG